MPRKTIPAICQVCNKEFQVQPSRAKHGRGKTCSRACQYQSVGAANSNRLAGTTKPDHWIDKTCPVCGQTFHVKKSHPSLHCSIRCARANPEYKAALSESLRNSEAAKRAIQKAASKAHAIIKSSEGRKRQRDRTKAQWDNPDQAARLRNGIAKRTASPEWRNSVPFQKGELHANWKGNRIKRSKRATETETSLYKQWRTSVFSRDDFTCQQCSLRGGKLNAHHIKSWADYSGLRYDVTNGVTLCEPCHESAHGKSRKPKTFACIDCNARKSDGRSPRCRSCGARNAQKK